MKIAGPSAAPESTSTSREKRHWSEATRDHLLRQSPAVIDRGWGKTR